MRCDLRAVAKLSDGRTLMRCASCRKERPFRNPDQAKAQCGIGKTVFEGRDSRLLKLLPEPSKIEAEIASRGMLLGDFVAELTAAVGIPKCGKCEARQQWLNNADAWVRSWFTSRSAAGCSAGR